MATTTLRTHLGAREPPHLRGKRWDSIRVDGHSAPTRIQSILCFDTRPDIDIENLSQTPSRFWATTRAYLHTIPGLVDFKLARSCSNARAYCLLLQWSSEAGWARFQSSLGLQLLMGLLDGQVANSTTCDPSVAEVGGPGQEFELIAFKFSSSCECSETDCEEFKSSSSCICAEIHRDDFKSNWCALAEDPLQLSHLTIKGDWLESNFTKGGRRVSREEPPKIFLGVITPVIGGMKMVTDSLFESELEKFSPKADLGLSRERFRVLESENFPERDNESSSEPMSPSSNAVSEVGVTTLAKLMEAKTLPHYTDVRAVRKNYQLISEEKKKKLEDQQDGKAYYEPPKFQFRALGDMGHRPWSTTWKQKTNPKIQGRGVIDLISFGYDGSEQVEAAFEALCREISNSKTVFRFQEEGNERQLSFILNQPTHDTQGSVRPTSEAGIKYDGPAVSRTSAKEKLRQSGEAKWREAMSLVEDFASRYYLSYETLSFPNYSHDSFLPDSILEVTTFPVAITDEELFETSFERYHLTFSDLHDPLQVFTNPPIPINHKNKACNGDYHGGWQEQDEDSLHHHTAATPSSIDESSSQDQNKIQSQTAIFLAVVSWCNSTARTGWYKEFAAQMDTYEAFGNKIHALQLLVQQQQAKYHPLAAAPAVVSRLFSLLKTYTIEQKDPLLGFHRADLEMALGRFGKKGKVLMKC